MLLGKLALLQLFAFAKKTRYLSLKQKMQAKPLW